LKKNRDGTAALSCTRPDGSVTWQRQPHARHDLTHYAVETVLGHRRGFYGLITGGWDFTDFGAPWPRGPLPADADPSELIVGLFDSERTGGMEWTTDEFNAHIAQFFKTRGAPCPLELSEGQLTQIRERMRELFARWDAVPPGETMELQFGANHP
jgi:hypothetical protein